MPTRLKQVSCSKLLARTSRMMSCRLGVLTVLVLGTAAAFAPPSRNVVAVHRSVGNQTPWCVLFNNREDKTIDDVAGTKKSGGLDENVRSKLVAESIAPWRTIRLFLYFALGSGAFVGGLITLSGVVAALGGARTDLDMNTEYLNLAIDFGAAAAFGLLAKFDSDKGAELSENVEKKIQRKKEQKQVVKGMREREKGLQDLMLDVQIATDGSKTSASIKNLQTGAKQHMIIVIGPRKACRDAMVGAGFNKMDFSMNNVLVVPYQTDVDEAEMQSKPSGGFGEVPSYESAPYVAKPVGDGWDDYAAAELDDAVSQSGDKVREEGIAIVIANNGKVIKRGVGKVPWRMIVDELQDEVTSGPKDDDSNVDIPFLNY